MERMHAEAKESGNAMLEELSVYLVYVLPLAAAVFYLFYTKRVSSSHKDNVSVNSTQSDSQKEHNDIPVPSKDTLTCSSSSEKVNAAERCGTGCECVEDKGPARVPLRILYGSTTGHAEGTAMHFYPLSQRSESVHACNRVCPRT
jgi:hypothetical protein